MVIVLTCILCHKKYSCLDGNGKYCNSCLKEIKSKYNKEYNPAYQRGMGRENHNRAAREYERRKYWQNKNIREGVAMLTTLILAGNHDEFIDYIKINKLNPASYRYIYSAVSLKGYRDVNFLKIGTYYNHPLWCSEELNNFINNYVIHNKANNYN